MRTPKLLLSLLLLAVPLTTTARGADEALDSAATKATITTLRTIGTAMFHWLEDATDAQSAPASAAESEATSVDWSRCPPISHDEAAALLVPKYLPDLPSTDGWGHPLELCMSRHPARGATHVLGVRSAGRDGVFAGVTYEAAPFAVDDLDHDLVWMDGYFVAWPQRAAP